MASIRKSFSFRNGVQVDEDNFIVNANGLVGIGTSVPSEFLDVRGTAKVVGLTTTNDLFVSGVATATNVQVGTAISITGGGVKATNFFGNGATLSNLPTSQWEDINLGLGFTSIYAIGNVGIATTDPRQSFQVGGDPAVTGKYGVGINSIGNIRASGIITATSFVGALTGNVVGNLTGNISGATVVSGNATFSGNIDANGNLDVDGQTDLDDVNISGSVGIGTDNPTSSLQVDGTSLTLINKENANNTLITVENSLTGNAGVKIKNTNAEYTFLATNNLRIMDEGAGGIERFTIGPSGNVGINSTVPTAKLDVDGNVNITGDLNVVGVSTFEASTELNVGTGGTALTALDTGRVGVGSANPNSDVTIRKPSNTNVEVVSDTGTTKVSIGNSASAGKSTGILRFGNTSNTFDVINNDTGDLNFIIDGDNNSGTGNFKFVNNVTERARITNDGKLGIAITNPAHQLHVVGTSTVTSNAFIGGNLSVGGTITGTLALGNVIEGTNLLTTSGISTLNQVNFTGSVGFNSATPKVDVDFQTAVASFSGVGIGTTNPGNRLKVVGTSFFETIGINTTAVKIDTTHNPGGFQMIAERLYLYDSQLRLDLSRQSKIGFGTAGDTLSGSLDLRKAGGAISPWAFLPEMTTSVRNSKTTATGQNASGIGTGAIIYNKTSNRVEIYLPGGSASANVGDWVGIVTAA